MLKLSKLIQAVPVVLFLGFAAFPATAKPLNPDSIKTPKMTPALNIGKMNYDALCASCHGKNAAGTDKGPTFLHKVYHPGHHGDGAFFIAPLNGVRAHHWPFGDMKPVEGITEGQIRKIIPYVRAIQQENGLF
jgi:mono/diheme cytochrome c family protein